MLLKLYRETHTIPPSSNSTPKPRPYSPQELFKIINLDSNIL